MNKITFSQPIIIDVAEKKKKKSAYNASIKKEWIIEQLDKLQML